MATSGAEEGPKQTSRDRLTPSSYLEYSHFCGPLLDNWTEPGHLGAAEEPRQLLKVAIPGINVEV